MVFLHTAISDARLEESSQADIHHADFIPTTALYGSRWAAQDIPRFEMPEDEMPPRFAYKFIKDELALDGNPVLNLASFVTTYMEEEAERLMAENMSKNFIDYEEYPETCEIHNRCVNMIARLLHAPMDNPQAEAVGCSTIGSSEAIILGTLAMKRRWQIARAAKGLPTDKPNLVMGANVQVCWEKAVKYLEIEPRYVYCTEDVYIMRPEEAIKLVDENTIGVAAILGSTYTGHYEDVKLLDSLLTAKNAELGTCVPIHVDAASGGFVVPFINPELEWDFRLPNVASINVSGHKYGLTYAGVGWAIWRSSEYLPKDLIFNINYLGSNQASFTLNFSREASQIIAQYYVLIRLGRKGFTSIMRNLTHTADFLANALEKTGRFTILSERGGKGLPLVAFRLNDGQLYDEFDVAARIRERGWIIPAYTMAPNAQHIKLLRVVVREDFSKSRAVLLITDIIAVLHMLDKLDQNALDAHRHSVKHRWNILKHITAFGFHRTEDAASKSQGVC